jgi:hypothetical protein
MLHPRSCVPLRAAGPWVAAALGLAGPAAAQTFGTGCAGHSGVLPALSAPAPAVEGVPFALSITAGKNLAGVLMVGGSTAQWSGFLLPLDLTVVGVPGCNLLVSVDGTVPFVTDAQGQAVLELPGFGGFVEVHFQAYLLDYDPTDFVPALALSKGLTLLGVDSSGVQPGDLVITEVMADPSFVIDSDGEWFELFNTTGEDIDLLHWRLSDLGGDALELGGGQPILVPAFSYVLLGNNGDPATNGGIPLLRDYSLDGTFNLANGGDAIVLTTPDGIEVDRIVYDGGSLWPDPTGGSMQLAEGLFEWDVNDDGSVWEATVCHIGGTAQFNTDLGTPGLGAGECPFPTVPYGDGTVIFSEVMQNPNAVPDTVGEWFELYNTTAQTLDLAGYTVSLGGGSFTVVGSWPLPPGGFQVFAQSVVPTQNGGLPPGAYDLPAGLFLPNGSQTLTIHDPSGQLTCLLQYDNGLTYPDPSGASMCAGQLDLAGAIDGAKWCTSVTVYGAGDRGTPGAANDPCGP